MTARPNDSTPAFRVTCRNMLRAVLLDVGGTLWPEKLPPLAGIDPCLEPLSQALPSLDSSTALAAIRRRSGGSVEASFRWHGASMVGWISLSRGDRDRVRGAVGRRSKSGGNDNQLGGIASPRPCQGDLAAICAREQEMLAHVPAWLSEVTNALATSQR